MLKQIGGIPARGNQRAERDAGCRFDFANPDAMKERSLPLPGGCWKLQCIRLHQEKGGPNGDSV